MPDADLLSRSSHRTVPGPVPRDLAGCDNRVRSQSYAADLPDVESVVLLRRSGDGHDEAVSANDAILV